MEYVRRLPPERSLPCGDQRLSAATLQHTLEAFQQLLATPLAPSALGAALAARFELIQATGRDGQGTVLFTGYAEMAAGHMQHPSKLFCLVAWRPQSTHVEARK
jgi:hypothetical protein